MDKSNLELFKQALNEAVSNKFDKMADECTEEIVYSEKHKLAMQAIIYGKTEKKRVWTPKMRRIIAILVAVALLLTSCGIIFRSEIREIFKDFFVSLTYEGDEESNKSIEEFYLLSYVPEGYTIKAETTTKMCVQYEFVNEDGSFLFFEQRALARSDYYIDSESGYSRIVEIEEYEVYYRFTGKNHLYVFNNGKYSLNIKSSTKLSNEDKLKLNNNNYEFEDTNVGRLISLLKNCEEKYKTTIIMTTNFPRKIDSKLLDKNIVPHQIFIGPPTPRDAAEILKYHTKNLTNQDINYVDLGMEISKAIINDTAYSAQGIVNIVEQAKNICKNAQITEDALRKAIKQVPPNIDKKMFNSFLDDMGALITGINNEIDE